MSPRKFQTGQIQIECLSQTDMKFESFYVIKWTMDLL